MPESSFEHNVQQSLEELRLKPSAQVWEDVERRIQKERKRRRMLIFWLPLATLLLGGGIATAILLNQRSASPVVVNQTASPSTQPSTPKSAGQDETAATTTGTEKKEGLPESVKNDKQNIPSAFSDNNHKKGEAFAEPSKRNPDIKVYVSHPAERFKTRTTVPVKNKKPTVLPFSDPYPGSTFTTRRNEESSVNPVKADETKPVSNEPAATVAVSPGLKETGPEVVKPETVKEESTEKKQDAIPVVSAPLVPKPPYKKRWEWGINFSPSFSQISDAVLNVPFAEQKSLDSRAGISSNAPFALQPPADNEISYQLYDMGFAYQAGIFVQKEIFKRSRIRLGLNYGYHSTRIQAGSLQSNSVSVVNSYGTYTANGVTYQRGIQQPYKTKFSYVEMPLTYQIRIGKGKNVPLLMHGSLVPGVLLASNMLHYDSTVAGVYFVDNKRLNSFLLSYETGLSVELGKKSKYPVTIGTQMRLGLSNLLKPAYGNRYMLSGGFNMTIRKRAL